MDDRIKIAIVVIVVAAIGLPLAAKVVRDNRGRLSVASSPGAAPRPAAETAPFPGQRPGDSAGAPAPPPAVAIPGAPAFLDATNLVNTTWLINVDKIGPVTVYLQPGGVATAAAAGLPQIAGTWTVNGTTLSVSAMGKTLSAQIVGDQLLADGKPVQRIR